MKNNEEMTIYNAPTPTHTHQQADGEKKCDQYLWILEELLTSVPFLSARHTHFLEFYVNLTYYL